MRIRVEEKKETGSGFKLEVSAGKQWGYLPVLEETFRAVAIGDVLEISFQFIPQPVASTEMSA